MGRTSDGFAAAAPASDLLTGAERFRLMQYVRLGGIVLVLLAAAAPSVLSPSPGPAVLVTGLYAGLVAAGEAASRRAREHRTASWLFGGLLVVDGLWLAWTANVAGGLTSPVRYLVLLHLTALALIAARRTVLLLATWHTVLLVVTQIGQPAQQLAVLLTAFWLTSFCTPALSAAGSRELRRRERDQAALTDLLETIERAAGSAGVARTTLESLVGTFGFARGVVLAAPEGQLSLLASHGLPADVAPRRAAGSTVVAQAQAAGGPLVLGSLDEADDPWLSTLLPQARNLVVVPLQAESRPVGALVLEHRPGSDVDERVVAGLERCAAYAALALRNAGLLEQVQRLAATDGLTKIANRRTFEATLEREIARATRSAEHVSLVMIDIDHFKRLNDENGHQVGDEVLRNVAAALSCECRDFDTPARYGGEEFAVVLPGCGPEQAQAIAERLRRSVAAAPSLVPITASAGVATYPAHAGDSDTLIRAADDALYESKREGRDRTTVSPGVPPEAQVDAMLRRAVTQRLGLTRPASSVLHLG